MYQSVGADEQEAAEKAKQAPSAKYVNPFARGDRVMPGIFLKALS